MSKSLAELLKMSRVGVGEADVRYWVERYVEGLVGGGVRCREVRSGCITLAVGSSVIRQELYLLKEDIQKAVQQGTGYEVKEIEIRFL